VKTPYEVDRIRRAARIACFGMQEFSRRAAPGVSGVELVAGVESAILVEGTGLDGVRRVRAFAQVATGPEETCRGWRPAEITSARRLQKGDIALLELAVVADGYWCDRTRARVAGKASSRQRDVNEVVRRAQEAAIAIVRPGVSGAEADEAARSVIRDAGLESAFVHITGHGLGYRYHEAMPFLAPWSRDILKAGMIHSVEPGVYLSDFGGIRIEDDVVVTSAGAEVLGPFSTDISS
jgi:Xaa-Pro dipeptidase